MATNRKQALTCWTCRVRHKKCDGAIPVCACCAALEIDCYQHSMKPQWMDHGARQQEMTKQIQAQVKLKAKRRRGIALIESITQDLAISPSGITSDYDPMSKQLDSDDLPAHTVSSESTTSSSTNGGCLPTTGRADTSTGHHVRSSPELESFPSVALTELDSGFMSSYLDYVFPILFPFYRPSVLQGGRSWLLALILKNKGFLSSIISLSALFFSMIPAEKGPGHDTCTSKAWIELQDQSCMALKSMQHDVHGFSGKGLSSSLVNGVHLLAKTMHLLQTELILTPESNWQVHLDAGISLFEQIVSHHGTADVHANADASVYFVLGQMGRPNWEQSMPSVEQNAFRFFYTVLLIDDILSATSLERPPRLLAFHPTLQTARSRGHPMLEFEDILGCQTWVLLLIGEIANLDAWKKEQPCNSILSTDKLLWRARLIEDQLQEGLDDVNRSREQMQNHHPERPLDLLLDQVASRSGSTAFLDPELYTSLTRAWAYATRIYLQAVAVGGRLEDAHIRKFVELFIDCCSKISSSIWLRTMVWPICVTGCFATKDQRPFFRTIIDATGALRVFGTVRVALDMMEKVWTQHDAGMKHMDVASCLNSLGHRVLLV